MTKFVRERLKNPSSEYFLLYKLGRSKKRYTIIIVKKEANYQGSIHKMAVVEKRGKIQAQHIKINWTMSLVMTKIGLYKMIMNGTILFG